MAGTYRVTIDVQKIQSNMLNQEGGRISEDGIRAWLRGTGFVLADPENDTWLTDGENLRLLQRSEILRLSRVN
jgi:hypothetical protein